MKKYSYQILYSEVISYNVIKRRIFQITPSRVHFENKYQFTPPMVCFENIQFTPILVYSVKVDYSSWNIL